MKLSGGFLIAVAQATSQPCGPRLEMSGLSGSFADLNGLWTFAMDGNGNVLQNAEKPYYKRTGGDDYMWWMWHGDNGHWVVNQTPGKDSTFITQMIFVIVRLNSKKFQFFFLFLSLN